jgi:hypothetical protein
MGYGARCVRGGDEKYLFSEKLTKTTTNSLSKEGKS